METATIQINGKYFKVTKETMAEVDQLVSTLYGTCMEPFLSEFNTLLGKIYWNNPTADPIPDLPNYEYIL